MPSKIIVATHKAYDFPQNHLYVPVQVGRAINSEDIGIVADNTGDNISDKNRSFCELTALYWAWKNDFFADSQYCGLVHYRRYFKGHGEVLKGREILSEAEIGVLMNGCDIIVPTKRNYYIESVEEHYANAHYDKDMQNVRRLITEREAEYLDAFNDVMARRTLHLYNMFIMTSKLFDEYMSWLFPLLFALEKEIDTTEYDAYQARVYGYIAERLFNVWILKNALRVKELPVANLEGENLLLKAMGLLKRKFVKKRR